MKARIAFAFMLVFALGIRTGIAQNLNIDCPPNLQQRVILKDKELAYFNIQGINMTKYGWDNKNLNCYLNYFKKEAKNQRNAKIGLYLGYTLGSLLLANSYLCSDCVGAVAAPGAIFFSGGIVSTVFYVRHKKRKERYFNMILNEYQQNPW